MSQILEECLPKNRVAVLSGPNHAVEVAQRIPAAGVIGSAHRNCSIPCKRRFRCRTFRAYTSDDVTGIQLGGALKNVFAISAGVSDGFNMGDNAKAGLVTRALAEMMRLGVALGGRRETFFGLSGVGDLMVTCSAGTAAIEKLESASARESRPLKFSLPCSWLQRGFPRRSAPGNVLKNLAWRLPSPLKCIPCFT